MLLSQFIPEHLEALLEEWDAFARTVLPRNKAMSADKLRDHAREMLVAIASDMQTRQSPTEQKLKSEGGRPRAASNDQSPAELHTLHRLAEGFSLDEVVSEYRALRASVIRLWTREIVEAKRPHLDELTRFNEALDESLCEAVSRYTARMERGRDLLLGALGHDLRTPLGAVLYSAQFLLRSEHLESAHTKAAARIVNSGARMRSMISDLLDFASTKLGDTLPISPVSMDLGDSCRAVADEMEAFHPDRQVRVERHGDLSGRWDPGRVAQMLSNLLGNAIKHGSPDAPISVIATGVSGSVCIEVHNQGPPIAAEMWPNLFEPLTRGAMRDPIDAHLERSVGLGLYIACAIVKAHGGRLELARSDENGTTFAATLPR